MAVILRALARPVMATKPHKDRKKLESKPCQGAVLALGSSVKTADLQALGAGIRHRV